jgi:hypothetical protein
MDNGAVRSKGKPNTRGMRGLFGLGDLLPAWYVEMASDPAACDIHEANDSVMLH